MTGQKKRSEFETATVKYRRKARQTNEKTAKFLIIYRAATSKKKAQNKMTGSDDLVEACFLWTDINKPNFCIVQ